MAVPILPTSDTTSDKGGAESAERQRRTVPDEPLRSAVIVNPARVQGLAERRAVIESALAAAGWPQPTWLETTPEDPGTGQARRAVADGAEVVFVCGGDGTVRSVIAGMVGTDAALALLPAGTGNLLAMNLGLPDDPAEGVRLAVERGRRHLDVGRVDGDVFAVLAGMGFDAAVMASTSPELKARIGSPAYVLTALRHLLDRSMSVEVVVDAQPAVRRHARTVLVGNVGRLQGGIKLLPDAEPDSGVLEVAILAPRHLGHWAAMVLAIVFRRPRVPSMQILRGSRITVRSNKPQPRELDGDVISPGRLLDVVVEPAAVWLCVAQPDESADLTDGA